MTTPWREIKHKGWDGSIPRVLPFPHDTKPTWLDPEDGGDHPHVWLAVRNRDGKIVAGLCRDCSSTYWHESARQNSFSEETRLALEDVVGQAHADLAEYHSDAMRGFLDVLAIKMDEDSEW